MSKYRAENSTPTSGREISLRALVEFEGRNTPCDSIIDKEIKKHGSGVRPVEIALATEIYYGVIRRLNTIDWILSGIVDRPLESLTPWIRNILRCGVYQLVYLSKIPARAAVYEAVKLAKKFGHPGTAALTNAVLRRVPRTPDYPDPKDDETGFLVLSESHPRWMVKRWLARWGYDFTLSLLRANNVPAPTFVRVNRLRTDPERLCCLLRAEGFEVAEGKYLDESLEIKGVTARLSQSASFRRGLFFIQDEASMLPARLLDPKPGETVVDACSAPGGKSTHIAELMGDKGRVIAVDVNPRRLELVKDNSKRLGLTSIETLCVDSSALGRMVAAKADRILVDAPCSGLGTIRRNPDLKWRRKPDDIEALSRLQGEILRSVAPAVKPGGVLVYSTCTTEEEENEAQVRKFLNEHPEFDLDDPAGFLPQDLTLGENKGFIVTYPHIHGIDGFFMARMTRRH
ncbi:MAG TPA: 16S rRNA (cytosine(967)-C(5))-methyltransferase RsmB [Clostridia bacterium]|nr:16S rRNA (cytosine(967)-C(5))-methyltransferase RsmB [Clostridia bacterium]